MCVGREKERERERDPEDSHTHTHTHTLPQGGKRLENAAQLSLFMDRDLRPREFYALPKVMWLACGGIVTQGFQIPSSVLCTQPSIFLRTSCSFRLS